MSHYAHNTTPAMAKDMIMDERTPSHQHRPSLSRQVTLQLSPDQYERLFFQPSSAKGDLSRRLGNPTLLGLLGFLVPLTSTIFCLCGFQGTSAASLTAVSGCYYFFGGIAMVLAGLAEFILGNTYPFVVFTIYGVHWVNTAYTGDPAHPLAAAYEKGAESSEYNAGQGIYSVVMALVTFVFLLGSVRTNGPFFIIFVTLLFLFAFLAAGQFELAHNQTVEGIEHASMMFTIAGGFGFVTLVMGWYLAIITVCASTGVPCPLPVFDLSAKVFKDNERAQIQEHAGVITEQVPA